MIHELTGLHLLCSMIWAGKGSKALQQCLLAMVKEMSQHMHVAKSKEYHCIFSIAQVMSKQESD